MPAGLRKEMPQVKNTVRLSKPSTELFEVGNRKFEEKRTFFVDSTFFEVFSFALVKGNIKTALEHPDNILISEDMAKKYFGREDPMGKIIRRNNEVNCTVTGVLANVPSNSHLQFDFILPLSSWYRWNYDLKNNVWGNFNFYTYLQLDKNFEPTKANLATFVRQMDKIYDSHEPGGRIKFQLQALTDIHLRSNYQVDLMGHGNIQYVNIFFVVALFILAVACINFMNLATARSARRAKEVGWPATNYRAIPGRIFIYFFISTIDRRFTGDTATSCIQ
jgi:ABC-type antimicrobial peptide transport system permease subunit